MSREKIEKRAIVFYEQSESDIEDALEKSQFVVRNILSLAKVVCIFFCHSLGHFYLFLAFSLSVCVYGQLLARLDAIRYSPCTMYERRRFCQQDRTLSLSLTSSDIFAFTLTAFFPISFHLRLLFPFLFFAPFRLTI